MIETVLQEMKQYAEMNNIPIMQDEGLTLMLDYIEHHAIHKILEIGTAIAYSTIQMAKLNDKIEIVSIERDEKRYQEACKNVSLAQLDNRITLIKGDALETTLTGTYDLIFIDAAKAQYIKFFERYIPLLAKDGVIVSDNLQFHGMVQDMASIKNRNTKQLVRKIKKYITYLEEHPEYTTTFYECGDGIAITKKKNSR